jgi:hypothetical protein
MPSLNTVLSQGSALDDDHRAALVWRRIQEKPTSITIKRGTAFQTAQTVRIEYSETMRERTGPSGEAALRDLIVFGVRNHPDSAIVDTSIRANDRFVLSGVEYQVMDVIWTLGEVQAHCEAVQ